MDTFTPYYDKMYSVLEGLSLKALENCNGKDTASLRELSNDDLIAKVGLYSVSKISKIAIGSFQIKGQKQLGCALFLRIQVMTFPCLCPTGMRTSQRSAGWLILCPQLMILLTKITAPDI